MTRGDIPDEFDAFVEAARGDAFKGAALGVASPNWLARVMLSHPAVTAFIIAVLAGGFMALDPPTDWGGAAATAAVVFAAVFVAGLVLRHRVRDYMGRSTIEVQEPPSNVRTQ